MTVGPPAGKGWTDKEMKLTRQLMDTLTGEWDPSEYRDTYSEVLKKVIEAKIEGKETEAPEVAGPPRVVSLMKALEESLKARPREGAKAPARRAGSAKRARGGRRSAA